MKERGDQPGGFNTHSHIGFCFYLEFTGRVRTQSSELWTYEKYTGLLFIYCLYTVILTVDWKSTGLLKTGNRKKTESAECPVSPANA